MKDKKFAYFQQKILEHLERLEAKELRSIKKSLREAETLVKAGLPIGTIRTWKGKKFIKIAPNKWKPKYDGESRGAKMAVAALKKKAANCTDSKQLMQLVLENRSRFSDESGRPLPFVQELSDYVSELNNKIESDKRGKRASADGGNKNGGHDGYPEKNYPEYKGKGQKAVDFIVKQKGGQVRGAFNRPEIGDIDVVWGKVTDAQKHKGYGLSHIIDKHGMDAARIIGEVITDGQLMTDEVNKRISIEHNGYHIGLRQQWNGKKKIWIVTSFQKEEREGRNSKLTPNYVEETHSTTPQQRGTTETSYSNSNYTGETLPATSPSNIPQSNEKSNLEIVESLAKKYAPESVKEIKLEFFSQLDSRRVKKLLDLVKKNAEMGETVKFQYEEIYFGKEVYMSSGLGFKTWDFDYRNPRFILPCISGYIPFSEIQKDAFNEKLLSHSKVDREFYEEYNHEETGVKLHHLFKFVKLLRSYDDVDELWDDLKNHKYFKAMHDKTAKKNEAVKKSYPFGGIEPPKLVCRVDSRGRLLFKKSCG